MSCSNCGKHFGSAKVIISLIVMIAFFTVSIVVLPYEFFFVTAIVVLVGLRSVEKQVAKVDSQRPLCSRCKCSRSVAPIH